jgi:cytochrome P450
MAYDENVYPNPEVFDPTRFLGEDQQLDPMKFIFGFGRRFCPGKFFSFSVRERN